MKKTKEQITNGVAHWVKWWIAQRCNKLEEFSHESMSINPFLIPLIYEMHGFEELNQLNDFSIGHHLGVGHATGFGKLIDEKILPNVFDTKKLDKEARRSGVYNHHDFDEIDHIVPRANGKCSLMSLKASRWTIQLTMAVQLNKAFFGLIERRSEINAAGCDFDSMVVGVIYGKQSDLTDKYDILRGINRGANHSVHDIKEFVSVHSGKKFWAWLNEGEELTDQWVLEGILKGINDSDKIDKFKIELQNFRRQYNQLFVKYMKACETGEMVCEKESLIEWKKLLSDFN